MAECLVEEVLPAGCSGQPGIDLVAGDRLVAGAAAVGRTSSLVTAGCVLRNGNPFGKNHIPVVDYNMATDETYEPVDSLATGLEGLRKGLSASPVDCTRHYTPRNGFAAVDGSVVESVVMTLKHNQLKQLVFKHSDAIIILITVVII